MKTRKSILLLSVMFAIVALVAGTTVTAGQVPLTDSCQLVTPSGAPTGYSVQVVKQEGEFPFWDSVNNTYRWEYQTNVLGSNSAIAVLIPYCTNPPIGIAQNEFTFSIQPAGNPGPDIAGKTFFGTWTDHDNVIKISNYNAIVGLFAVNTVEKNPARQTSIQFKSGNNFYFCPGIKGPDCIELPPPITSQAESFTLGQTGCVMQITLLPNGKIADARVFDPADPTNFNCPASGPSLTIESLGATVVCTDANDPSTCQPLNFVQKNIMAKSGDQSTYCYYTTTGYRVCKTF